MISILEIELRFKKLYLKLIFKGRIAHGMLTTSLISAVLGMKLLGPIIVYLGDTIIAEFEVIEKI